MSGIHNAPRRRCPRFVMRRRHRAKPAHGHSPCQICELAMEELRNSEIAARLFLSAKTVEANLSRAYRKLGVRSRTELSAQLRRIG